MKIKLMIEKEYDVKYLLAECGVRYWEDSQINGIDDTEDGENIPCKEGDYWCPKIDIETGQITNWETGKTANIHYKVCDDGSYQLLDESLKMIAKIDGYVPSFMSPKENGYGDYVIMDIDENGHIKDWEAVFDQFNKRDK